MTAPDTWTFAVIIVATTVGTLLTVGGVWAIREWWVMRHAD